jgi:3-oxoadipate enol-lactonase
MTTNMDMQTSSGFLPVEGGQLYYEVTGSGHPLVLIHAGVADLRQWDPQIPAFAARYRVIRYDTRGFGRTTTEAVSFSNRQDLYDLLTHLGVEKAYLIGNSRGGQIAIDFTLEHPEMVDALIPVAAGLSGYTPPEGFTPAQHETDAEARMEELWEKHDLDALTDLEVRFWADGPGQPEGRAAPEVREKLRQMISENYARNEPEPTAQPLDPPAAGRQAEIRVPTLVMIGDLDESVTQVMADAMEAGIPGARKVVFPGVAHMVSMERPEEFTRHVLDFLDGVSG